MKENKIPAIAPIDMRIIGSQKGLIECKSSIIFESEKRGIFFIISINLGEKYPITPKKDWTYYSK